MQDIYHRIITEQIRYRRNYYCSKLSDSEIITLAVIGEIHGIYSEKAWFNYVRKILKTYSVNFILRNITSVKQLKMI